MNVFNAKAIIVCILGMSLGACSSGTKAESAGKSATADKGRGFVGLSEPWGKSIASQGQSRYRPVVGTGGMVVSDDRLASEWGAEILRRGGNAVDAAVATAFVLSVTRPHYAALGGGGLMVYCPAPVRAGPGETIQGDKRRPLCSTIDYREMAPARASRDMYLKDGKADSALSQNGALAPGVPGVTAGLLMALEKFGTQKRAFLMSRAIELAQRGFIVSSNTEAAAENRWSAMNPEAKRIFGCKGSKGETLACPPGTLIKQPDLARVLQEISRKGSAGFYEGWVAKRIAEGLAKEGGIMSAADLAAYEAKEREPVAAQFADFEVVTMPPPSAGGVTLIQMLRYMEMADQQGMLDGGFGSVKSLHSISHGMSLAFADRAKFFGDMDFVSVPIKDLTDADYLKNRWRSTFRESKAALPETAGPLPESQPLPREGMHTTHFSVIDKLGNAVALTTTVNDNFGSGFVPPGTGVVMNNEMDDFSSQPGVPNLFGLVGAEANAIAPGKRPLSSMTPTIVRDLNGQPRIVIGAQGGPRITTSVFLALLYRLKYGMSIVDAVSVPRIHHQWKPMDVKYERNGFAPEVIAAMEKLGYEMKEMPGSGRMQALERFPAEGRVWGAPDPRTEGVAIAE